MEEQQFSDFELYQQIIEEIQEQNYQNLEMLLSLIIKYGIPMFFQMYNFQIFEQIFSNDLKEQELIFYYQILYIANIKFKALQEQKLETEIYYRQIFQNFEEEFKQKYKTDLKKLKKETDKLIYFNQEEQYFLQFFIDSKLIFNQEGSKYQLLYQYQEHVEKYINLISQAGEYENQQDQDSIIFKNILIEYLQDLYSRMENFTKQGLIQNNYPQQNQNGNHIIDSDYSYNEKDNSLDNDEDNDDFDNYQDNNYDADDDFGLTQSTIFQNYKSKVLDNDSKSKSRVINVVELEKMKQQEKEQNQQKFYEDQYQNEDDIEEDEQYKFLMQSQILSRRKRPEEERKLLEEVDRYQEPLGKQISEPYTQSQIEQKSKKDCCRSYFIQGEKLNKKDQTIEYKNYQYTDLNNNIYKQLKQIICGMLNSNGGTILIGVEDNSFRVVGLNLSINEQDDYKLQIWNCVVINQFNPQIGISDNQIRIKFIPVKTKQNKWINGQWIVKIQITPNLSYQMYKLQYDQQDKFQSYLRINGQTKLVKGIELKQYLYDKCKQYYDNDSSETHKCFGEPDKQGVRKCTYYKAQTNNNKIYQNLNRVNDNNPLIKKKEYRNQNSKINYKAQNDRSNILNKDQGQYLQQQREEKIIYKNIQEVGNFIGQKIQKQKCIAVNLFGQQNQEQLILYIIRQIGQGSLQLNKNIFFFKKFGQLIMYSPNIQILQQIGIQLKVSDLSQFFSQKHIFIYRLNKYLIIQGKLEQERQFVEKIKQRIPGFYFDLEYCNQKQGKQEIKITFNDHFQLLLLAQQLMQIQQDYGEFFESSQYKICLDI